MQQVYFSQRPKYRSFGWLSDKTTSPCWVLGKIVREERVWSKIGILRLFCPWTLPAWQYRDIGPPPKLGGRIIIIGATMWFFLLLFICSINILGTIMWCKYWLNILLSRLWSWSERKKWGESVFCIFGWYFILYLLWKVQDSRALEGGRGSFVVSGGSVQTAH